MMKPHATLFTRKRHLQTRDGKNIVIRGINLPLLDDWNFPGGDSISELALSGANAVRIQWYVNYPNAARPAFSLADLDDVLGRCAAAGMIPILMLADLTCDANVEGVNSQLVPWWTASEVVSVLLKHRHYLIINVGNEVGTYRWADDSGAALTAYSSAYLTAIKRLRDSGLAMPIMIDAPDCGTSLDAFLKIGQELIDSDSHHNILLSAHAYWAAYDGIPFVTACVNAGLPIIFGEVANKQDEQVNGETVFGYYDLDGTHNDPGATNGFAYQQLLLLLKEKQVGWLAWSWGPDGCAPRCISADRQFDTLTPYGEDIVNNPSYGTASSRRFPLL